MEKSKEKIVKYILILFLLEMFYKNIFNIAIAFLAESSFLKYFLIFQSYFAIINPILLIIFGIKGVRNLKNIKEINLNNNIFKWIFVSSVLAGIFILSPSLIMFIGILSFYNK